MTRRRIDMAASTFAIRTRAKGLLSRLAHDLEIYAEGVSGDVELTGDGWRTELEFPVAKMRVVGVLKGERVDRGVLSSSDRAEIERKIQREVLPFDRVSVTASGKSREAGEISVRAGSGVQSLKVTQKPETRRDGELVARGSARVSLKKLGVAEVKGPLGAFKVDDEVELVWWVMLEADTSASADHPSDDPSSDSDVAADAE